MRAFVTGASGFIGSTLIEELGALGFEVDALMRERSSTRNLEGLRYHRVPGSLSDGAPSRAVREALDRADYVFHLAGVTVAPNARGYFENNAGATARLARWTAERATPPKRFVLVSSLAACGPAADPAPLAETAPERPVSAYGKSKLAAEREILAYRDRFPVTIIRPPLVYGPKDRAVFLLVKTVARNVMPLIRAAAPDGRKLYSVIHVRDLCRGIVQGALAPHVPSGEIFNLCGDGIHSYEEILSVMADHLGAQPLRLRVPRPAVIAAAALLTGVGRATGRVFTLNWDKLGEVLPDYWICSNEKARRMLGFQPEVGLREGLRGTIDWYRERRWL